MSHTVTVPFCITSIPTLEKAVQQMKGLEFKAGKSSFKTYGESRSCEHAIGLTSKGGYGYEVGVVKGAKTGEYQFSFDSFDSALAEVVGYNCEHLIQGYAKQLVLEQVPFGWNYTEAKQSNGDLIVEMYH